MFSAIILGAAGILFVVTLYRPRVGLAVVLLSVPYSTRKLAIRTPIQELDLVEVVFYAFIISFTLERFLRRKPWRLHVPLSLVLLVLVNFLALTNLRAVGAKNIVYIAAFVNMLVFIVAMRLALRSEFSLEDAFRYLFIGAFIALLVEAVRLSGTFGRLGSTVSSPNQFGDYLLSICLPLTAVLALHRGRRPRWMLGLTLAAYLAIALTGSRGTALALVVGLLVFFYLSRLQLRGATVGIVLLATTGLGLVALEAADVDVGSTVFARYSQFDEGRSVRTRRQVRDRSMEMFKEHPFIGNGPAAFVQMSDIRDRFGKPILTHSAYLDLLVSVGLFGILLMLLFLWRVFRHIQKTLVRRDPEYGYRVGLTAAIAAMMAHLAVFNGAFQHQFWLIAAMCLAYGDPVAATVSARRSNTATARVREASPDDVSGGVVDPRV